MTRIYLSLAALFIVSSVEGQDVDYSYFNTELPFDERVDILVSQMTLEEKTSQMLYNAPAISRLNIPEYNWWNESLHGVARAGYATVFPQSITIAASWDKDLMYQVADVISTEARAKHHEFVQLGQRGIYQGLTMWSPNINIFRDPRWGRGHETYGEDPYLTGQLGAQYVKGLQGDDNKYLKVVATAKHFAVHSGPEKLRHEFDANVSDQDLHETYLPAFKTLVQEANVYSIMSAYNLFRGKPCSANPFLYDLLRNRWKFNGYIVSDCWAISDFYNFQSTAADAKEASGMAVRAGTDLNCGVAYKQLNEAVSAGLLSIEEIDRSVKRLFLARFKLGMFDPVEEVGYAQIPYGANASDAHDALAREAARKSMVLLKNENQTLPLSKSLRKIAVIGPNANNWEALVGNYNGIARNPVTLLQGLKNKLEPEVTVSYAEGSDLAEGVSNLRLIPSIYFTTESSQQGLVGEYFSNTKWSGSPIFTRIDNQINFYWEQGTPSPKLKDDNYSVRWTGYLTPPVSGIYKLGSWGMPSLSVELDGKEILKVEDNPHHAFHSEKEIELQAGRSYKIVYKYRNHTGDGDAKLLWSAPHPNRLQEAIELAKKSDVIVLGLGLSQRLEGEEMPIEVDGFDRGDRTHLKLPKAQLKLLKAVKATGKPLIVVLMNGSALSINWADQHADAILLAGYPGQQGGNAIADVLFGDYNPAGRLPVTYYRSVDQLPDFENYDMMGRTYRYFDGEPLYAFGHGLSYTSFDYSDLKHSKKIKNGDSLKISVQVTNTGKRSGEEVVQLYLTDQEGSTARPIRQLEGFQRIELQSGETREVNFTLSPYQLSMINSDGSRVIESGKFTIAVGGKQPLAKPSTSEVLTSAFTVTGEDSLIE